MRAQEPRNFSSIRSARISVVSTLVTLAGSESGSRHSTFGLSSGPGRRPDLAHDLVREVSEHQVSGLERDEHGRPGMQVRRNGDSGRDRDIEYEHELVLEQRLVLAGRSLQREVRGAVVLGAAKSSDRSDDGQNQDDQGESSQAHRAL